MFKNFKTFQQSRLAPLNLLEVHVHMYTTASTCHMHMHLARLQRSQWDQKLVDREFFKHFYFV